MARSSGNEGTDRADYGASLSRVDVDLGAGRATGEGTDTLSKIEDASGSKLDDTITGSSEKNDLDGKKGEDTISGGADEDNIQGNEGQDTLNGDGAKDAIYGGDGEDTIDSGELQRRNRLLLSCAVGPLDYLGYELHCLQNNSSG